MCIIFYVIIKIYKEFFIFKNFIKVFFIIYIEYFCSVRKFCLLDSVNIIIYY